MVHGLIANAVKVFDDVRNYFRNFGTKTAAKKKAKKLAASLEASLTEKKRTSTTKMMTMLAV